MEKIDQQETLIKQLTTRGTEKESGDLLKIEDSKWSHLQLKIRWYLNSKELKITNLKPISYTAISISSEDNYKPSKIIITCRFYSERHNRGTSSSAWNPGQWFGPRC